VNSTGTQDPTIVVSVSVGHWSCADHLLVEVSSAQLTTTKQTAYLGFYAQAEQLCFTTVAAKTLVGSDARNGPALELKSRSSCPETFIQIFLFTQKQTKKLYRWITWLVDR